MLGERTDDDAEARRVATVYDGYARSARKQRAWAADNPGNVAIREELRDRLHDLVGCEVRAGARVLDIGCGGGHWLAELASMGAAPGRLHGIDVAGKRTDAARRRVPGASVVTGDAAHLPWGGGRFGLVLLFTVLSSLRPAARVAVLAEATRAIDRGGRLIVYEPRVPNPLNPATQHVGRRELERALGAPAVDVSLTVLPILARHLGRRTAGRYKLLSTIPALRSHRLRAFVPRPE